jgi:hypothetical protein
MYYQGNITSLASNEIFVFGSNLRGVHGAGAAKYARDNFSAELGRGYGFTGQCYALPTKDFNIKTMDLDSIQIYVKDFIRAASEFPDYRFVVTKVGCGLAGYTDKDIAPMFKDAPSNCIFHLDWMPYLERTE